MLPFFFRPSERTVAPVLIQVSMDLWLQAEWKFVCLLRVEEWASSSHVAFAGDARIPDEGAMLRAIVASCGQR